MPGASSAHIQLHRQQPCANSHVQIAMCRQPCARGLCTLYQHTLCGSSSSSCPACSVCPGRPPLPLLLPPPCGCTVPLACCGASTLPGASGGQQPRACDSTAGQAGVLKRRHKGAGHGSACIVWRQQGAQAPRRLVGWLAAGRSPSGLGCCSRRRPPADKSSLAWLLPLLLGAVRLRLLRRSSRPPRGPLQERQTFELLCPRLDRAQDRPQSSFPAHPSPVLSTLGCPLTTLVTSTLRQFHERQRSSHG